MSGIDSWNFGGSIRTPHQSWRTSRLSPATFELSSSPSALRFFWEFSRRPVRSLQRHLIDHSTTVFSRCGVACPDVLARNHVPILLAAQFTCFPLRRLATAVCRRLDHAFFLVDACHRNWASSGTPLPTSSLRPSFSLSRPCQHYEDQPGEILDPPQGFRAEEKGPGRFQSLII